jgi:hypothetical protein
MHYKKIIRQWKHKLNDARFLWQGNLPNRASKIQRLLARHEFTFPGQALSYTSAYFSLLLCLTQEDFTPQVESAATQWVNKKTAHASS